MSMFGSKEAIAYMYQTLCYAAFGNKTELSFLFDLDCFCGIDMIVHSQDTEAL